MRNSNTSIWILVVTVLLLLGITVPQGVMGKLGEEGQGGIGMVKPGEEKAVGPGAVGPGGVGVEELEPEQEGAYDEQLQLQQEQHLRSEEQPEWEQKLSLTFGEIAFSEQVFPGFWIHTMASGDILYDIAVVSTIAFDATADLTLGAELDDFLSKTQTFYRRTFATQYGISYNMVHVTLQTSVADPATQTLTVRYRTTIEFSKDSSDVPTVDETIQIVVTFDKDPYLQNFVRLSSPQELWSLATAVFIPFATTFVPTVSPSRSPSAKPTPGPPYYDIVIVGAGLAGISAATRLKEFLATPGEAPISYVVLEASSVAGGRGVAAVQASGDFDTNPLLVYAKEQMGAIAGRDYSLLSYTMHQFDKNGLKYPDAHAEAKRMEFADAQFCVDREVCLEGYVNGEGTLYTSDCIAGDCDISLQDALYLCGWPTPAPGTIEKSIEDLNIIWPLLYGKEKSGLYNYACSNSTETFGNAAPAEEVGEGVQYLLNRGVLPRAYASIGEHMAAPFVADGTIRLNTKVDKIKNWNTNDNTEIVVTQNGVTSSIMARTVIDTTSVGVRERRGDCKYASSSDPYVCANDAQVMYDPVLSEGKMAAIRDIHFDETRVNPGVAEYRQFFFQFGANYQGRAVPFWDTDRQYLVIDSTNTVADFNPFEILDESSRYPGTNSFISFLLTEEWDRIAGSALSVPASTVNSMLAASFGKAYGINSFDCTEVPFPGQFPPTTLPADNTCVFSQFSGVNDLWYGAYSTWRVQSESNATFASYQYARSIFPLFNDKEFTVWYGGTTTCDRHSEFVHGAWWSGIITVDEVLESVYLRDIEANATDEFSICYFGPVDVAVNSNGDEALGFGLRGSAAKRTGTFEWVDRFDYV